MYGNIIMENNSLLSAEILSQCKVISMHNPQLNTNLIKTPVLTLDNAESHLSKKEMENHNETLPAMIDHSDATSIGDNGIISSHPRPDARRILDDSLLEFDLQAESENIKLEGNWKAGNQSAKTLMKSDHLRVVLIAMHKDNEMKMHQSDGPITLQVLEGNIQFTTWQHCITITAGQIIALHKRIMHNVLAKEQSIILLTIVNLPATKKKRKPFVDRKDPEEKDKETIEQSENINFPDFPTYPEEDDIYREPVEPEPDKPEQGSLA